MQSELEAPATSAKKKAKKQRAAVLDELLGGSKDGGSRATSGGSDGSSRKKKDGSFAFLPCCVGGARVWEVWWHDVGACAARGAVLAVGARSVRH
jgi:membrane protein involved in colicin uptake